MTPCDRLHTEQKQSGQHKTKPIRAKFLVFFFSHIWDQLEIVIRNALYIKEPANTLKNAFATSLTDTVVKKECIKDKIFCDRNSRYGKQVLNFVLVKY